MLKNLFYKDLYLRHFKTLRKQLKKKPDFFLKKYLKSYNNKAFLLKQFI